MAEIKQMIELIKDKYQELEKLSSNVAPIELNFLTGIINEEWRSIDGYLNYQVSNIGRVRNITTGRILKPVETTGGYLQVSLMNNNKVKHLKETPR